ncbi:hypothetical protein FB567DRAFT_586137 [Paraphoma chrysanthemicola]|uniref:Uncharacterized protein n=1 Tax=Paraphoma chrysanthemicola TaxID=798071 RepID=A0A8K0RH89_9PLEO|nr:hypothetical protein FB567DRAFT_586137 [Paraphoma chrysanthemicola]
MEVDHQGNSLAARRNAKPDGEQASPIAAKESISVAAIFKKRKTRVSKASVTQQPARNKPHLTVEHAAGEKEQTSKTRSSSRSPRPPKSKVSKRRPDLHPLAVAFKGTSEAYRRHLYTTTISKIDQTLQSHLDNLYESTLHAISSPSDRPDASPIRLSAPAKLEREAQKLYIPLSAYTMRLTHTNTEGEREQFKSKLGDRMADYAEHIEQQKREIEKMCKEWEVIVGEIWKFGVGVLGGDKMHELLFSKNGEVSSPSKGPEGESTLFVPEEGTSPRPRRTRSKRKVTFEAPGHDEEGSRGHEERLDFLYGPSRLRVKPAPDIPTLPDQDIENLDEQVRELGEKETKEFSRAEKDYELYWRKKTLKFVNALRD